MVPPFRAEHVGSLLRPPALLEQRRRFARGEIDQAALIAVEDRAISDAVALQERVGLRLATDGEFRRASYHGYFYGQLGDISFEAPQGAAGSRGAQPTAVIKTRVTWKGPIHGADFAFLSDRTKALPKITIPGPCALHFRGGDAAVTAHAYRDVDQFWDDIVAAFQKELRALAAAGCTYVQIDETAFAKFGDADVQAMLHARGDDPEALIDQYIAVTNDFKANDTYANQNNDPESHLKTAAYIDQAPDKYPAGQPVFVSGLAISGLSGLKRVEYWLRRVEPGAPLVVQDDETYRAAPWTACELESSPEDWSHVLPPGTASKDMLGFDATTGRAATWPLRYSMITWFATLRDLKPGKFEFRARAVDMNDFPQPEPRPIPKAGKNAVEVLRFEVV